MKKIIFLLLLINTVIFAQLDVRKLNEELMLNQGYSQSWGKSNMPEAILEARP